MTDCLLLFSSNNVVHKRIEVSSVRTYAVIFFEELNFQTKTLEDSTVFVICSD